MSKQQRAPAERGEGVGESAHRKQPPGGQVDSVHGGRELDQVAGALPQGGRLRGVAGPVGVDRSDLLPVHGGEPRMRLALHPVAGGEQLPAKARLPGHVAVQMLAVTERPLRGGEVGGRHRGGELRLVPGRRRRGGGWLPLVVDRGRSDKPGNGGPTAGLARGRSRRRRGLPGAAGRRRWRVGACGGRRGRVGAPGGRRYHARNLGSRLVRRRRPRPGPGAGMGGRGRGGGRPESGNRRLPMGGMPLDRVPPGGGPAVTRVVPRRVCGDWLRCRVRRGRRRRRRWLRGGGRPG